MPVPWLNTTPEGWRFKGLLTPKMPDEALNAGGDVSDHYRPAGL
jgi:hypothetical protein